MKNISKFTFLMIASLMILTGCSDDDDNIITTGTLTIDATGLEALGSGYDYEGWIIVDGAPISAGIFDISENTNRFSFELDADDLNNATAYVLTIEPSPDPDPAPSKVHILAGDFSGSSASLDTRHGAAIGTDFTEARGAYILATPTDGSLTTDELSGVWWEDPSTGPGPSLSLPVLPDGWKYEGWAVINGIPVSTGTFTSVTEADDAAPHSGAFPGPPYPGEDFLVNAPAGLSFPTDLSGTTMVISVEPSPDNSPAPFALKPLVGGVPADAVPLTLYDMSNNAIATNPSAIVTR